MAVNETIVTGRKFRKCIDAASKAWQRISFWTKSSDVEFEDGKNAETKLGAIDGITDSLEDTSSRMAASAKAVSTLNNNLGGCQLAQEGNDFYIVGADSVRKKLGEHTIKTQTLSSGRCGAAGNSYKFVFNNLSKVDGIKGVVISPYMSSGGFGGGRVDCIVNISGNIVTITATYGFTYYEFSCTAFEIIN